MISRKHNDKRLITEEKKDIVTTEEQIFGDRLTATPGLLRPATKSVFIIPLFFLSLFMSGQAEADCVQPVGEFVDLRGEVETQLDEDSDWQAATFDTALCEGSSIRVGARDRKSVV